MIHFKKYSSIENTFDRDFVERIVIEGFDKQEFVVQEKVHGANVCFITDGVSISFGKRTALVEAGEKFYDHEEMFERYKERVFALFSAVKARFPDVQSMTVFGEMCGGSYPHPDVPSKKGTLLIQKGVYYSPSHEFYAFDLYVTIADSGRFLPLDVANDLFAGCGFLYAQTLLRGPLSACLSFPNDCPSRVSEWLNLPPIANNICEGIVIRPVEPAYLSNGARVLLKSKNARFEEKTAVKKREPRPFVPPTFSPELENLLPIVEQYVTQNRLNNVVSKIGEVSMPEDGGKLIGLFSKDILDDFLKEHASEYEALEKSEQKLLNRQANMLATNLIKEVFLRQISQ